ERDPFCVRARDLHPTTARPPRSARDTAGAARGSPTGASAAVAGRYDGGRERSATGALTSVATTRSAPSAVCGATLRRRRVPPIPRAQPPGPAVVSRASHPVHRGFRVSPPTVL